MPPFLQTVPLMKQNSHKDLMSWTLTRTDRSHGMNITFFLKKFNILTIFYEHNLTLFLEEKVISLKLIKRILLSNILAAKHEPEISFHDIKFILMY